MRYASRHSEKGERKPVVNPIRGKALTNVCSSGTDEAMRLVPWGKMVLEY
jgi:predicted membrane GTPase involved in stress response